MSYSITLDPSRQEVDAIHRLLTRTYWSPGIRREVVAEALRNSITAIAIEDATSATVGIARVVTDRATFAWLCDVFVVEEHRGRGLANKLIDALEQHPQLQTLRRWCLITRDAHALYAQRGYAPVAADRWMEKLPPSSRWQAPGGEAD